MLNIYIGYKRCW